MLSRSTSIHISSWRPAVKHRLDARLNAIAWHLYMSQDAMSEPRSGVISGICAERIQRMKDVGVRKSWHAGNQTESCRIYSVATLFTHIPIPGGSNRKN